ncbi:MAG: hypothetical protein Q8L14_38600 [Myxococcales bacterium]|nr:hypothetical protein [Myxococcales bacterium]
MNRFRFFWLIPILVSGCPEQIGSRCGPDLPPCPSGTACVDATCQDQVAGGGVAGDPVIGCVDTVGRIVFVSTDARGIDTTADWPMEGHDPAKTFNTATDLTRYACP